MDLREQVTDKMKYIGILTVTNKPNAYALIFDASYALSLSALDKHQIQSKYIDLSHFPSKSDANLITSFIKNKIILLCSNLIVNKQTLNCH